MTENKVDKLVLEVIAFTHKRPVDDCPIIETFDFMQGIKFTIKYLLSENAPIIVSPDLLEAIKEVVIISDRKHIAWDKTKSAIKNCNRLNTIIHPYYLFY